MNQQTSYDEHLQFLVRQKLGAEAELQGYRDAQEFAKLILYSQDRFLQDRYANGYYDGKAKIRFGRSAKTT